jgi:hypothetical protein
VKIVLLQVVRLPAVLSALPSIDPHTFYWGRVLHHPLTARRLLQAADEAQMEAEAQAGKKAVEAARIYEAEEALQGGAEVEEEAGEGAVEQEAGQDAEEEAVEAAAEEGVQAEVVVDSADVVAMEQAAEQAEVDAIVEAVVQEAARPTTTAYMDPTMYVMSSKVARWVAEPPFALLLPPGVSDEVKTLSAGVDAPAEKRASRCCAPLNKPCP